ncbi:MAG TPA: tetratricopeptide repeat protein [Gemmatimonadaceae bacterium]
MRSSLEFRRASLIFASLTVLAGCATATRRAAISSGLPTSRSGEAARPALQKDALARALSAYDAGDYPAAGALFEAIVARDPSPASIAVFRLATLLSWDNQFDEAIALYRRYIVMEPRDAEGRLALARTLAWQGQYASAIATYDSLIASNQRSRDAVIGRAQTLAWSGRLSEALAAYKGWLGDHPNDRDASI